ncbi:probable serine/threonine-protein kinase DDB_G0271682 [Saccostrea cucullata]|uniref:probable serine/threonine-protein kinase DDB_G0271682 n=1 Tax=Saccostrea cuccullata TaxID=36930 RepID=UPI002ED19B26
MESTTAYIKFGKKWTSKDDHDSIDDSIRKSLVIVHSYLQDHLGSKDSDTIREINCIKEKYEKKLEECINKNTEKDELTSGDVKQLHLSMKKEDEDYPYFVHYDGSAVCKEENTLQFVIKKYKCSLEIVLDESNLIDEKTKLQYALEAARGLRFLHNNEVIHGAVKLSSFLVDENNHVVIFEMGHSNHVGSLRTNFPHESLTYLAPELRDPSAVFLPTKSSDIFSFGLLLWELYNRKPIEDNLFVEKLKETEGDIVDLIRACVHRNPEVRPTISQVVSKLYIITQSLPEQNGERKRKE